jgi:hypothetical protein
MPEETFFLLPEIGGGKHIYIKRKGGRGLYRLHGAENEKPHDLRAKRLSGHQVPHSGARAAPIPVDKFFRTAPGVVYED